MSKVIAIWGNSGAYKTSTAAKLALDLSAVGTTLLLSLDSCKPGLAILLPQDSAKLKCSLGRILAGIEISADNIYQNIVPVKGHDLGVIAYRSGENRQSYAEYTKEKAAEFLMKLRTLAKYIVVDCTSNIGTSTLTNLALQQADKHIYLCSADLVGLSFYMSQFPLISDSKYKTDSYIKVLALPPASAAADINGITAAIGGASHSIPYTTEVRRQMVSGTITDGVLNPAYNKVITLIRKELIADD